MANCFEPMLAIAVSAVSAVFSLYVPATWRSAQPQLIAGTFLFTAIVGAYVAVKVLSAMAKEKDSEDKKLLQGEVALREEKIAALERNDQWALKTTAYVQEVIRAKLNRLCEAGQEGVPIPSEKFVKALDPKGQVHVLLALLHEFFRRDIPVAESGASLRIALYTRHPVHTSRLTVAYSLDGSESERCISQESEEFMVIDDPRGPQTVVMQLYHSKSDFIVISDCESADPKDFRYLRDQQRAYLKSLMVFKHVTNAGAQNALILSIDCGIPHFFRTEDTHQLRSFLVEIMKRVEYEVTTLDLLRVPNPLPQ